ncbi:hypothetical protein BCR34DRAFT_589431 [Clohesyomyces aquaticus]|uniref:BCL5p n=1 Tax=Clohesyomyces aquaticus TaxID=1231657 RepID=A0A1Y1ZH52_9PLEO|nr:hypothetical protein BCR34DRAFT_589431 [Clohesyomyces aquaticus]
MAAIAKLFGASQRTSPPPIETDDVYPVHMLDDSKSLRDIVVAWTLRFDDVLDSEKLHSSLLRLLEIGDWRKLGGRLRLKENGELEIYVPQHFSTERPAVSYSHQAFPMDIEDHPLAKTLPKATDAPSIQPGSQEFMPFAAKENAPTTLEDFIYQDVPQLSLHITSFNDATLVALSWPHTLMDVMGQQALLRGWTLVLAGQEHEFPPMLGARDDAICAAVDASDAKEEEFKMNQKRLKGLGMLKFGLNFAWDMVWNRVVETRTIFLPRRAMAELRRQAMDDLAAQKDGEEEPFISEGDVLTAWAIRAVALSLPNPRPVTALHALNARFRLPSLIQAAGVYVQNMAVAGFAFISPEVARGPLGPIALENRRHLMEQATQGQVLAAVRELRQQRKDGNEQPVLCGDSGALLMPFTNWTRAAVWEAADFGPAVLRTGRTREGRSNKPGSLVYHHASSMKVNPGMRNVFVVLGKDCEKNYWISASLLPQAWVRVEDELRKLS